MPRAKCEGYLAAVHIRGTRTIPRKPVAFHALWYTMTQDAMRLREAMVGFFCSLWNLRR